MDSVRPPVSATIAQLARGASIEIGVHDLEHLHASRAFLPPGTKVYVSFLPRQTWHETEDACRALRKAGFDPVPHVPVRLLPGSNALERLLHNLIGGAQVREVLLIAGDYPRAAGPYSRVADVLCSGLLEKHGLQRVSLAGHPEGHPSVPLEDIRRAEREKAVIAAQRGLEATFVTQFFFEPAPFLGWIADLRAHGTHTRAVAGLAGPARIATLFKFAMRCGVGPSIRALGARPASLAALTGELGPQKVVRALAEARAAGTSDFGGLHFYCFGGWLRTCEWLHHVGSGRFTLNHNGGFELSPRS
jgi:methylenetetrahydrofolate reductase (NADPH)